MGWFATRRARRLAALAAALLSVAAIGWIDFATGPAFGLSLFYAVPVFLTAQRIGPVSGAIVALAGVVAWTGALLLAEPASAHAGLVLWNAAVRAVFFAVLVALSVTRRKYADERRAASTDPLTGIANRRRLDEVLERELARVRRSGAALTVAYLDCDNFKAVNDRFGHATGNDVLRAVAKSIATGIREVDLAARIGGDEFVVLLVDADGERAREILNRLRAALTSAMQQRSWPVTFSVGAATTFSPPRTGGELLEHADRLMYRAKAGGKSALVHEVVPRVEALRVSAGAAGSDGG